MLTKMRENMALVMWILVIAFIGTIVFSWGMGGFKGKLKPGILANIDGKNITVEQFERIVQQAYENKMKDSTQQASDETIKEVREQAWNELVQNTLIDKEINRLGIPVTDREVAFAVRNSPPDFIQKSEYFQTDGKFDMSKYQSFLADPAAARDLVILEANYRQNMKSQKLIDRLLGTVRISKDEILQAYEDKNIKATVSYVFFDQNSVPKDSSDFPLDQVQEYYYKHVKDFKEPEKRNAEYVMFEVTPTEADTQAVEAQAEDLLVRIQAGEDFATLAKDNSEDQASAEKGGDLGFFGEGRMVKEFEEAAFAAKVGEVVGPVKSRFGYHIIKVTDRKIEDGKVQVRASHILLKFKAGNETIENARNNAYQFAQEAKKSNFHELAKLYGVTVQETDYFPAGDYIPRLGRLKALNEFIFNQPIGHTSETYYIRDAYYIFHIIGIRKETTKSLEEVKANINNILRDEQVSQELTQKAKEFRNQIQSPTDFERVAQQNSLKIDTVRTPFAFDDYIPGIGRQKVFNGTALELQQPGDISQPVPLSRGCYVIKLLTKTSFDSTDFKAQEQELSQQLLIQKRNTAYQDWLAQLKANASIKDHRYLYYRDY
jgi:peptidyl-prolyl cis-trans isomerase D